LSFLEKGWKLICLRVSGGSVSLLLLLSLTTRLLLLLRMIWELWNFWTRKRWLISGVGMKIWKLEGLIA